MHGQVTLGSTVTKVTSSDADITGHTLTWGHPDHEITTPSNLSRSTMGKSHGDLQVCLQ